MATYASQPLLGLNFPHFGDYNQQAAFFDIPEFYSEATCDSSQQQQTPTATAPSTIQTPRNRALDQARFNSPRGWGQQYTASGPQSAVSSTSDTTASATSGPSSSMASPMVQGMMPGASSLDFSDPSSAWGGQFDLGAFDASFPDYDTLLAGEKSSGSVDPSLLQPGMPTPTSLTTPPFNLSHVPHPASPALSQASSQGLSRTGSTHLKHSRSQSPYLHNVGWQPYPSSDVRRASMRAASHPSPSQHSTDVEEESNKTRCPFPDCGKVYKDLKAHMLTHQNERPEKCPITSCEYNKKGFSRKYDKNRHTLTHYKGTMVCGFCPHSGSAAEKSFNRADVFKRHLTTQHGVEQNPPNSRRKGGSGSKSAQAFAGDATGKCSICSGVFSNAQDFYEHLEDCVLSVVQKIDPSEDINEKLLSSVADDQDVKETLGRHNLPNTVDTAATSFGAEEDDDDEEDIDEEYPHKNPRSGKGVGASQHVGGGNISKESRYGSGGRSTATSRSGDRSSAAAGLTYSKGGVLLTKQSRKRRKNYPISWNSPIEKMKMKKRVLTVWDGQRRLTKDDMMLGSDCEVRMRLPGGTGDEYITDLDVQTLRRSEGFFSATEEERGPWVMNPPKFDLQTYISNYIGRTRLDRLQNIGRQSLYLSRDALSLAVAESKRGKDVSRYIETVGLYHQIWPNVATDYEEQGGVVLDQEWAEQRNRAVKAEGERLESELKGYKNNLIKESIRVSASLHLTTATPLHTLRGRTTDLVILQMGTEDLATHHLLTGDLPSTHKHLTRMREYCAKPKDIAEMHLKLCLVAVAQEQWTQLQQSVHRVQSAFASASQSSTAALLAKGASSQTPSSATAGPSAGGPDGSTEEKKQTPEQLLRTAYEIPLPPLLGLASMCISDLHNAAAHFLRTSPDYFTMHESPYSASAASFTTLPPTTTSTTSPTSSSQKIGGIPPLNTLLLTPSDIATYATLTALCTYSRTDLSAKLLHNPTFRPFLDEEPHLRRAIAAFVAGKYATVLGVLEAYWGDWRCDVFLGVCDRSGKVRIEAFIDRIRERCIVQFASVFSRVSVGDMQAAFSSSTTLTTTTTTTSPTPTHLLNLIKSHALPSHRLDAVSNELVLIRTNERTRALERAVEVARDREEEMRLRLFRGCMRGAGLEVQGGEVVGGGRGW
ncbi:MAG: hypothetical protein M1828_003608 [Chrysothrix sp. TS-e1954]|nr:MAG: hypothetical protein M1828_003608 [Chrysothrix sp. TS-e1954]